MPETVSSHDSRLKLTLRRNPSERKKHQCEATLENDTVSYTGVNYGREGAGAKAAGSLLIGVHRKGSDTVRLLPAAQLFVMRPSVKAPKVSLEPPATAGSNPVGAEYASRKRQLVTELGAAKARKKQKAVETGAVSASAVLDSGALENDISGAASAVAAAPAIEFSQREMHALHPAFELGATSIAAAYPPSGFAPEHVWEALDHKSMRQASKSVEERERLAAEPTLFPPFILATLAGKLPSDKVARTLLLRATLYLTHMLRFSTLQSAIAPTRARASAGGSDDGHPDAKMLRLPAESWQQLLADFTEPIPPREGAPPPAPGAPAKRRITPPLREKLCMYALALALVHVCDGQLRCDALAATLGLTEEKCAFYLKQLGCVVEKVAGAKTGVLRLPLTFPKASRGGPPQRK